MKEKPLKDILLESPKGLIDKVALDTIHEWDEEPKAIQILKTLDMCVHSGLANGFVIHVLEQLLAKAAYDEKTTYEELIKEATWRNV